MIDNGHPPGNAGPGTRAPESRPRPLPRMPVIAMRKLVWHPLADPFSARRWLARQAAYAREMGLGMHSHPT